MPQTRDNTQTGVKTQTLRFKKMTLAKDIYIRYIFHIVQSERQKISRYYYVRNLSVITYITLLFDSTKNNIYNNIFDEEAFKYTTFLFGAWVRMTVIIYWLILLLKPYIIFLPKIFHVSLYNHVTTSSLHLDSFRQFSKLKMVWESFIKINNFVC